jgi:hypothetical protein
MVGGANFPLLLFLDLPLAVRLRFDSSILILDGKVLYFLCCLV